MGQLSVPIESEAFDPSDAASVWAALRPNNCQELANMLVDR